MTTRIPNVGQPLVDPKTGLATRDFYLFLLDLFNLGIGGALRTVSVDDLQVQDELESAAGDTAGVVDSQAIAALEIELWSGNEPTTSDAEALLALFDEVDAKPRPAPVSTLTPAATTVGQVMLADGTLFVSGGTVTALAISRDGIAYYPIDTTSGPVPLCRGDYIKATYSVAPTYTFFPR